LGGLAICFFLLVFWPLQQTHAGILLIASALTFIGATLQAGINLSSPLTLYGMYDLAITLFIATIGISWFGRWRSNLYEHRRELVRLNEELDRANRLKTDFLGMACHDLKNPLNLILGNTQVIEMKMQKNDIQFSDIACNLERIQVSSEKMLLLIQRFLKGAELQDGELRLLKEDIDLSELVQATVTANGLLAEGKGQRLIAEIQPHCRIRGDRLCLEEIVDNLLNNAIKYSPRDRVICLTLSGEGSKIRLRVQDQGPGFTPEDTALLFQRHQRLSAQPTAGESSEGLGLAIVKKLVDAHDGRIWLESEAGCGTTFHVEFPSGWEVPSAGLKESTPV
jgi:signal transduction histidine kinase